MAQKIRLDDPQTAQAGSREAHVTWISDYSGQAREQELTEGPTCSRCPCRSAGPGSHPVGFEGTRRGDDLLAARNVGGSRTGAAHFAHTPALHAQTLHAAQAPTCSAQVVSNGSPLTYGTLHRT